MSQFEKSSDNFQSLYFQIYKFINMMACHAFCNDCKTPFLEDLPSSSSNGSMKQDTYMK